MKRSWIAALAVSTTLIIAVILHKREVIYNLASGKALENAKWDSMLPREAFEEDENTQAQIINDTTNEAVQHKSENTRRDPHFWHSSVSLYSTLKQPSSLCTNNTFLFIAVISQPSTQKHRQIYRETVLSPITNQCLTDIKYAFVIGRVDNDEMQNRLDKESEEHGDILQGNFTDSYENLTIKSIFLVRWTALKCPQAKFLLKLDDDVFTILDDVRYFFKHETLASYSISGSVFKNAKPVRDPTNKWHAGDYTGTIYPTYVSGTAYIISSDLLKPISIVAMKVPFLRLEDIFITGLSAAATNLSVQYYQVPGFSYVPRAIGAVDFHYTKSIHGVNSAQLKTLHNRLKRERIGSCV